MTAPGRPALFDVRAGEGRRLLVMGTAMAAILAAHTIAETARDSMFLRTVPSQYLSIVYVALAGAALLVLKGNAALIRRVGRRYALVSTLMLAAYGTMMFYLARSGWATAFGLYLWTGLLGTVVIVQFWLLAASMFTSTEGKRLYGLVAAMGALGAFLGASLAAGVLLVVSVEQLLPIAAGFYLVGGLLLTKDRDVAVTLPQRRPRPGTLSGPVRLRDQPYVFRLVIISVLATAAAVVSDYLLKTTAVMEMTDAELPSFFARYNSVVSILSLVVQLVGASWIMRRAGVLGAVTLLPLALGLGGAATIVTASAFVAIMITKGADATLKNSVNRIANELLWMPVASDIRTAIREPLESVVGRVVQAIIAALLLVISLLGLASPHVVAAILIALAVMWFAVAASLRSPYLSQLRTALMRPTFETDHELDVGSLEVVVEALSSIDDRRVIAAIQVLQRHHRSKLIPALLLRHDSPEVLRVALDAIGVANRTDWIPLTRRLLVSDHPLIRIAAIRALARMGHDDAIEKGLEDQDPVVRATAVFWDAHTSPGEDLLAEPGITAMLTADDGDSETVRRLLIEAIRDDGDARWAPVLEELARTVDPGVVELLASAIERVPDARFLPFLIERLGTRSGRSNVRAALIAIGIPAIDAVETALADESMPPRIRLHLPTTLALFGIQRGGDILLAQLAKEKSGAVRYRLLRAITRLAIHHDVTFDSKILLAELDHHIREHFRLLGLTVAFDSSRDERASANLVRGLLGDKTSQARDRVFLVLEALHPRDNVRSIERAFVDTDRGARAHALEFLDTLTRAPLYDDVEVTRDAILVAYEDLTPAEMVARMRTLAPPPRTSREALARMLRDSDSLLAACAAYHSLQLGPSELAESVIAISHERPLLAPLTLLPARSR
ncbi:MAG: HEAT repeat domain-containing protein [Kofleriaceae bacterium]